MRKKESIEKLKSYIYLGNILCENKNVKTQVAKANALMAKVRGIGQRECINDW